MSDEQNLKYTVEIGKTGSGGRDAAMEFEQVDKAAGSAGKSVAQMGREFKTALAAVAGAAIVRESIQAFTEQDAAVRRLNGTLAALGRQGRDTSRELQALAQSVALPPGASRNSVLDAISELVRNGASGSELPRLTQDVLNLAAAGYGVERAADAMGNAVAGDFGKLAKILNVDFPAAAGRANNLAEALRLVQERFGGLAASTAGGLGGQLSEFNENLTKIKASLGEIILTGLSPIVRELSAAASFWAELINGKAPAPYVRPAWAPGGPLGGGADNKDAKGNYDLATAQREMDALQRAAQLRLLRNEVPVLRPPSSVSITGATGAEELLPRNQLLRGAAVDQIKLLEQQLDAGKIKAHEFDQALDAINQSLQVGLIQGATAGFEALTEAHAQAQGQAAVAAQAIQRDYAERRRAIDDYVQGLRAQMDANGNLILSDQERANLFREQALALKELAAQEKIAQFAAADLGRELQQVGQQGVQAFASGLSNAFVQAFRTGKMEFRAFAADFLGQIAQMIMQALILATIKRALGGTGVGAFLGFAEGGFAPRMAAAGALNGVQNVSTATYFPNFNTVAGEAGSEVLAVLSRPRFMQIGGLASYVGQVQGSELAMTNARDLRSAVGGQQPGAGGVIKIMVSGTRDFEARVTEAAVQGAVVEVHNQVQTDTGLRTAIKEVNA